jgi:hypothetical protein
MDNGVDFESTAPSIVSSTAGCPVFCWAANGSVVALGDVVSWLSVLQVSIADEGLEGGGGEDTSAGFRALGSCQSMELVFDFVHFEDLAFDGCSWGWVWKFEFEWRLCSVKNFEWTLGFLMEDGRKNLEFRSG